VSKLAAAAVPHRSAASSRRSRAIYRGQRPSVVWSTRRLKTTTQVRPR
jgi:hypothetical protein